MKVNRQEVGFVYGCFYYVFDFFVLFVSHIICGAGILLFAWFLAFGPALLLDGLFFLFLKPVAQGLKFLYSLIV